MRTTHWSLTFLLAIIATVLVVGCSGAASKPQERALYVPSANAMADVDATLAAAAENNRLALIVLGANWCHDSRALAARLEKQPLSSVVSQNYETVLVDVGFFEAGFDVVRRFGPATFYATPTVLIIDPVTGKLVNDGNRHQWGAADTISMADSVSYFETMAARPQPAGEPADTAEWQRLSAEIDAFEQQQARRVDDGYTVVAPLLEALKRTDTEPAGFRDQWMELAKFRNQLPKDVDALRADARARLAAGETDIELDLPTYPPLSWEE